MAKTLILNGSSAGDVQAEQVQEMLIAELQRRGQAVEALALRDTPIAACRGCFGCWVKTPGVCVINDAGRDVARQVIHSSLLVMLTPVTFGGYSSELKKAIDRLNCLLSPMFARVGGEVHHQTRYESYPALLGVGVLGQANGDSEATFKTLVARNAINWHSPAHASWVARPGQDREHIAAQINELLNQVGVGA